MALANPVITKSLGDFQKVLAEFKLAAPTLIEFIANKGHSNTWLLMKDEMDRPKYSLLTKFGYKVDWVTSVEKDKDNPMTVFTITAPDYPNLTDPKTVAGPTNRETILKKRQKQRELLNQAIKATQSFCSKHSIPVRVKSLFDWRKGEYLIQIVFEYSSDFKKIGSYFPMDDHEFPIRKRLGKSNLATSVPPGFENIPLNNNLLRPTQTQIQAQIQTLAQSRKKKTIKCD